MAKKNTGLRLRPEDHKKLKLLSVEWEMPMGDVLKKLLSEYGHLIGEHLEKKGT